jgi:succinate-semialdehyde dehydrogenase/glutarate-semialdehyde dehydrogenase
VQTAVTARYQNTGQSCIAAKRFIVEDGAYEAFLSGFIEGVKTLKTGDPAALETNVGPLARGDLRTDLEDQVRRSLDAGARVGWGGSAIDGRGYFYSPTVITGVEPGMPVFDEETFGPVAAVVRARDAEQAIELANRSKFGLGAALWTRDLDSARTLARRIEAGAVFINGMVASHPALPFGGVKRSGYGRELGEFGIREFVNIKTVWIGPRRDEAPVPASE